MQIFFEAAFVFDVHTTGDTQRWNDRSTADYFIFASDVGMVRLRKRLAYPRTFAYAEGTRLYFGYGDVASGARILGQPLAEVPEPAFYGEEFLYGVADCSDGSCRVQRDALGTVPLFTGVQHNRLVLSNKYGRVYELLDANELRVNEYGLAQALVGATQTATPLIQEIDTLTDRVRVIWSNGVYTKTYPPHSGIAAVVQERQGDPKAFRKHFEDTLDRYWQLYATNAIVGADLSGGLDSSSICGYYASKGCQFYTTSLVHRDSYEEVMEKLAVLEQSFGLTSHTFMMDPSRDHPLAKVLNNTEVQPFYHADEVYAASMERTAAYLQERGVSVIFRGIGGDDLFENIPQYEQRDYTPLFLRRVQFPAYSTQLFKDRAMKLFEEHKKIGRESTPVPLLSSSVCFGLVGENNIYLDHDIWPVMPMTDSSLFLYCQSLPIQYRANRNIMRAYMHARQFPEAIFNPTSNTGFMPFFVQALQGELSATFKERMRSSVLVKKGFVDAAAAERSWSLLLTDPEEYRDIFLLYRLLVAEINLQLLAAAQGE